MSLHWKFRTKPKAKKSDRQKLIVKLDTIFSLYIRLRDSDDRCIVTCITCGARNHYTESDCGHFVTRENMGTRWEEENCNGQCQQCNRFKSGKQYEHGLAIDKKFKPGTASLLVLKGKSACNFLDHELEQMIIYYKVEVKRLKEEKGILSKQDY